MSKDMSEDLLEILIGKHIDGEITPAEQRLLDAHFQDEPEAQALFERLVALHTQLEQMTAEETAGFNSAEVIVDRAMGRRLSPIRRLAELRRRFPFAAGLAAGLLIGLALFLAGQRTGLGSAQLAAGPGVAKAPAPRTSNVPGLQRDTRNIEWVSFTDEAGGEWLVGGYHYRSDPRVRACGL